MPPHFRGKSGVYPCCVPHPRSPHMLSTRRLRTLQEAVPVSREKTCGEGPEGQPPHSKCFLRAIQQSLEGDSFMGNRCERCMTDKLGAGGKGEKECLSVLGPKVQGGFLRFLFCCGKLNEVARLEAEERAAWRTAGSSSSLAPNPTRPSLLPAPEVQI